MELYLRYIIFIISFLLLSLIIFIEYKIGKRKGLKKALYRITYRSLCVIVAFIMAPYLNEFILNYNLYARGWAIHYNGLHFYRIIDFIEEIIVHNEILNDIYNLFPSLKNLLMDFPQVLFIPFTYILTFILISILLLPLYSFLSYKRTKRVLYDKSYSKKGRTWAGILTAVQSIFVISIILTPINGLTRVYKNAKVGLIDKNSNICKQNSYLVKYDFACEMIEGYNNSAFGIIGMSPINEYIYGSLTRIHYDDKDTDLNKELVSIAKAGIILNKTGLIDAINVENFDDVTKLNFNGLTEDDIDIVVEAFEQSLYTRDVVFEVYEWAKQYLDWLIKDLIDEEFTSNFKYEDIVKELKIVLKTINYILNNNKFIDTVTVVYKYIDEFLKIPERRRGEYEGRMLFFNIAYNIDVDSIIEVYNLLKTSKIYNDFVPQIIDHLLKPYGIRVNLSQDPNELHQVILKGLELVKIIQNHHYIYDVLYLLNDLTIEEVHKIASVAEYLMNTRTMNYLAYDLINFGISYAQLKLELPVDIIYKIENWDRELELVHLVLQIVHSGVNLGNIDYDKAWYALTNYNDTLLFKEAFKYAMKMLPKAFTTWIAGKDYKYLVGEYV